MFTIFVYHNLFTTCSPCIFTIIISPYVHHMCLSYSIIYSSCMFTIVTSQHAHYNASLYGHHLVSIITSPSDHLMFSTITSALVHHVWLPYLFHHMFTMHDHFTICSPCMAIVYSTVLSIKSWEPKHLDEILRIGDRLYRRINSPHYCLLAYEIPDVVRVWRTI